MSFFVCVYGCVWGQNKTCVFRYLWQLVVMDCSLSSNGEQNIVLGENLMKIIETKSSCLKQLKTLGSLHRTE